MPLLPMFDLQSLVIVYAVHVHYRADLERGVELDWHTQSAEHHVCITVLGSKRLVCNFQTRRSIDRAINPCDLSKQTSTLHKSHSDMIQIAVFCSYSDVVVIFWHIEEGREALTEPHGDFTVHVNSKGFKSFLKATHCVIFESAGIFSQIHTPHLRQAKTADGNETWRTSGRADQRYIL